jgi:hypothetical protein
MLVLSDDLYRVNPQRLRWASLLVPYLGMRGLPVYWLEREMPGMYRVMLQHEHGIGRCLLCSTGKTIQQNASCSQQLISSQQEVMCSISGMAGIFRSVNLSDFPGVPAHGCVLLRVCEAVEAPQLVGDTLHISGGAEFQSASIAGGVWMLETVDLGRRVDGDLWLKLSRKPLRARCNGEQVELHAIADGVYRMPVSWERQNRSCVVS